MTFISRHQQFLVLSLGHCQCILIQIKQKYLHTYIHTFERNRRNLNGRRPLISVSKEFRIIALAYLKLIFRRYCVFLRKNTVDTESLYFMYYLV